MKVSKQPYVENYHDASGEKFVDNWQRCLRTLPFSSNVSTSVYDKRSSLQSTVGQFVRLLLADGTQPLVNFEKSVLNPVRDYLVQRRMDNRQIEDFLKVVKDVFDVDGNLNIADVSFFKYLPVNPDDTVTSEKDRKKYADGLRKIADYLVSMFNDGKLELNVTTTNNLFLKIVSDALASTVFEDEGAEVAEKSYTIPQYIRDSFTEDVKWLLTQNEQTKVKYFHLLLHFYACYAVTQTLFLLSAEKTSEIDLKEPEKLYFILASEKASLNHEAVLFGWPKKIQERKILEKLFGKMQALDIANSILGRKVGYYPQVFKVLSETPFEENSAVLTDILASYEIEKMTLLHERATERDRRMVNFSPDITSYEEFLRKLERCCVELQSTDYRRIKRKVVDLMRMRFLSTRRGNDVLVIDNEMLSFLIALMTKGRKVKLEDMYRAFNRYGMFFNRTTRAAIENYLLKMNLLDRKSDSGEVQYVRAVL